MVIVVCPLSRVAETIESEQPERVISLLDPTGPFPELGPRYAGRHLRLTFHDVHESSPEVIAPSLDHVRELLEFVRQWDGGHPLLVHCRAGISRSTAAAYVVMCLTNPHADEFELALILRRASPLARPNETLVSLADREMGRNRRMSEAIASTGRDLPWIEVEENEPFRMALIPR